MSDEQHYGEYLFDDPWITGLVKRICEERDAATARAELAESALSAEFAYAVELVNRYGVEQWRRGVKGQASVEFTHWKASNE